MLFRFKYTGAPQSCGLYRHCLKRQPKPRVNFRVCPGVQPWQRIETMNTPCRWVSKVSACHLFCEYGKLVQATISCILMLLVCSILVSNQRSWQMSSANPLLNCLAVCSGPCSPRWVSVVFFCLVSLRTYFYCVFVDLFDLFCVA